MIYDNPAAALQSILEHGVTEKHDQPCHAVWARLLDLKPEDQGGLIPKLGSVMELPRKTLAIVQTSFPNQLSSAQIWMSPVETAFLQQQLAGTWGTFAVHIQPYCIAQLGLTAELIQTRLSTCLIPEDDIISILTSVGELQREIDESKLDNTLKAYLGRELCELQQLLRNYRITGAHPVLKQAESMLGHSLLDPSYSRFLTDHALGARLLESLSAMANVLTVAVSLPQLTQGLGGFLLK